MVTMDEKRIKYTSMFMLILCCFFIMGGSLMSVCESYTGEFSYTGNLVWSLFLVMIPVASFLFVRRRLGLDNIRHTKIRFSDVLIIFLFYLTALPVGTFLNLLSQLFTTNVAVSDIGMLITEVPFIPAMILTALVPAIQEELMCRGIIFETFRKADPLAAILISSLFFGMLHGNLNQMIYATYLGFVMALVLEATGSIFGSMVFHFLVNASSTVFIYLQPVLLKFAKFSYATLLSSGMEAEAEAVKQAYGGSFELEDYLRMAASAPQGIVRSMLVPNLIKAVIFGVAAFFVLRWLAKRNGRWGDVKAVFRRSKEKGYEDQAGADPSQEITLGQDEHLPVERMKLRKLCPPTLITAFIIMLMDLILDTLLRSGLLS